MQRSRAIDELIDPVVDKFKARSRKTGAVYELLKVDLRLNFERFLKTELQNSEDHAQEQLSKERERSDRYRSWWRELSNQLSSIQTTNGDGGMSTEEWARLRQLNDSQLRTWVTVGAAMERKGHDSPMSNGLRWVEDNSPHLADASATQ